MTHYDKALQIAENLETGKWELGAELLDAIETESRTIREFALERDKETMKEDTYSNYTKAVRFRRLTADYPCIFKLHVLPISYWYSAWRYIERNNFDEEEIERVLDKMYWCAYDEQGKQRDRFKGVRIIQAMSSPEKSIEEMERMLSKKLENYLPLITGRKEAMNASEALRAWRLSKLVALLLRALKGSL
jgi:hypothetical protein